MRASPWEDTYHCGSPEPVSSGATSPLTVYSAVAFPAPPPSAMASCSVTVSPTPTCSSSAVFSDTATCCAASGKSPWVSSVGSREMSEGRSPIRIVDGPEASVPTNLVPGAHALATPPRPSIRCTCSAATGAMDCSASELVTTASAFL